MSENGNNKINRAELFKDVKRVVIKVGSGVLTRKDGAKLVGLDINFFHDLAREVAALKKGGVEALIVSSGAMAAGAMKLKRDIPDDISHKQAYCAIGQSDLIKNYEDAMRDLGLLVAQVLLTQDDLGDRRRFLNSRHTLVSLLDLDAVPIINENDTVAVHEIKLGDNDFLSAMVANLVHADALVILTTTDGLMTGDPEKDPSAKRIPLIDKIDSETRGFARGTDSAFSAGGMVTKIEAARQASQLGALTIIADGKRQSVLKRIFDGEDIGTLILPSSKPLAAKKHWIAYTLQPKGVIRIDSGAAKAIESGGKSLLPSGIIAVEGEFSRGDSVHVKTEADNEIARGITNYSCEELEKIKGLKTSEIEGKLGYKYSDEVIHRDEMALV